MTLDQHVIEIIIQLVSLGIAIGYFKAMLTKHETQLKDVADQLEKAISKIGEHASKFPAQEITNLNVERRLAALEANAAKGRKR